MPDCMTGRERTVRPNQGMGALLLDDIVRATQGRVLRGSGGVFAGVSIDSRTIRPGELFVAIPGDRFDGHNFILKALEEGSGALVSIPPSESPKGKTIIHVKNTLQALQDIARFVRSSMQVPVIAVTGTNGKTTTKEMIVSVFSVRQKVLKTSGNLNNHIGLPLCIANRRGDETVMVLEMGSNAPGDIRDLCEIAAPTYGVTTNVGPAHLEGFGSLEMVRKTDLEILGYVEGVSLNADDAFLMEGVSGFSGRARTYGIDRPADVTAREIVYGETGSRFLLTLPEGRNTMISLRLNGRGNIYNALAAASVADAFGISPGEIREGLEAFAGVPLRMKVLHQEGMTIISDVYNANPASMDEALSELKRLKRKRAVAVLGDMLELGDFAAAAHRGLVERLSQLHIDVLVAVGAEMIRASGSFSGTCLTAADSLEARSVLAGVLRDGDTVLVKGSRGMKMERVLDHPGAAQEGDQHAG